MQPAPFFAEIADAPESAHALWLTAGDGVRLRLGVLGTGARGTVLLFPGRTEFVEKYGPAARDLAARGYGTLALDWRGQGLADRPLEDTATGHVDRFVEYQRDVAAMVAAARALDAPRPWFLLGHSMGGGIGLRALSGGRPVAAAAFSAPMWGIAMSPLLRPAAWALTSVSRPLGIGARIAPSTSAASYVVATPFAENMLTNDPQMYAWMQAQVRARPELALGGPSVIWVGEALRESRDLCRRPAPALPCYTAVGTGERIVDVAAIRQRMRSWPGARLEIVPDAAHELMMETPDRRARFFDAICAHFGAAGQGDATLPAAGAC